MTLQGEGLHLLAADAPMIGDALRGVELVDRLIAEPCAPAFTAGKRIGITQRLPGQHGRGNRNPGHGLHPADGYHVLSAAHHRLRGKMQRLL